MARNRTLTSFECNFINIKVHHLRMVQKNTITINKQRFDVVASLIYL